MNLRAVVIASAKRVHDMYPDSSELDDLISQGYLIALEKIDSYDEERGASLGTFLNRAVEYGLSDYVRRTLIKEDTLGGLRVDVEGDIGSEDISVRVESKEALSKLLCGLSGEQKVCVEMLSQGYSMREIGEEVGLSKQRVYQLIQDVRDDNES